MYVFQTALLYGIDEKGDIFKYIAFYDPRDLEIENFCTVIGKTHQ